MRADVVNLLPASMVVTDMVPDDVGTWLFHCHVNDHLSAGMSVRYRGGWRGGPRQRERQPYRPYALKDRAAVPDR